MSYLKLFRSKLNIVLIVFFSAFLLIIPVKSSDASTCIPWNPDFFILRSHEITCPNSGEACEFNILENKFWTTTCTPSNIATTLSPCRIRGSAEPIWKFWYLPLVGNTLLGPCFMVIASAPNTSEHKVTIWWQEVVFVGSESACFDINCFFCSDISVPPDGIIDWGMPDCGLRNHICPD